MSKLHKIVVTGPESTGKSDLTAHLSKKFRVPSAAEYARYYLSKLERPYEREDLDFILQGQIRLEKTAYNSALEENLPGYITDTGPEVLYIWSEFKYGKVSPAIRRAVNDCDYRLALLCDIDLPWQYDPQRETPDKNDRIKLLDRYRELLTKQGIEYKLISGSGEERLSRAEEALKPIFSAAVN